MLDDWFCEIEGREIGPLSFEQLQAMAASGQILRNDGVRRGARATWQPAQNVKGLFSQAVDPVDPQPAVSVPSFFGDLPAVSAVSDSQPVVSVPSFFRSLPEARPAPEPPAVPPSPPLPPPLAPMQVEIAQPIAVNIVTDPPEADFGKQGGAEFKARLYAKRRARQQQMAVILLLVAIVGLAIAALLLVLGRSTDSGKNKSATTGAKKTRAAQPDNKNHEALKSEDGADSLDAMPKQSKTGSLEPSKKHAATSGKSEKGETAGSDNAEPSKSSGPQQAPPKKKPCEPQPGTPEGDFGLPEVDPTI
jgi:hypothetical protein